MTQARVQSGSRHVADMAVLIPVWQPDRRLTGLVCDLLELGFGAIIIVNDGSGPAYDFVFDEIRAVGRVRRAPVRICRHDENLGKGRALKTGLNYFRENFP